MRKIRNASFSTSAHITSYVLGPQKLPFWRTNSLVATLLILGLRRRATVESVLGSYASSLSRCVQRDSCAYPRQCVQPQVTPQQRHLRRLESRERDGIFHDLRRRRCEIRMSSGGICLLSGVTNLHATKVLMVGFRCCQHVPLLHWLPM